MVRLDLLITPVGAQALRAIPKSDEGWPLPGISYILPPTIGGRLGEWFEASS